jgi:hypothetical protein
LPLVLTNKEVAMTERKEVSREEIAQRAYELYLERCREGGRDAEYWIRAEKELSGEVHPVGTARTRSAQSASSWPN